MPDEAEAQDYRCLGVETHGPSDAGSLRVFRNEGERDDSTLHIRHLQRHRASVFILSTAAPPPGSPALSPAAPRRSARESVQPVPA